MPLPNGFRRLTAEEAARVLREAAKNSWKVDVKNLATDGQGNFTQEYPAAVTDPQELSSTFGIPHATAGMAARSIASSAIPLMVGRGATMAAGALGASAGLTTGPAAPIAVPALAIGGAIAGAGATQLGQDYILNKLAERYPSSAIADFQRAREVDAEQHPYASMIAGLPASVFGGGSFLPSKIRASVDAAGKVTPAWQNMAKMAGMQGGVSIAQQVGQPLVTDGRLGSIDPITTAIGVLGGAGFSGRSPIATRIERNTLKAFKAPEKFINRFSPEISPTTSALKQEDIGTAESREKARLGNLPPHERPGFNSDYLVGAPIKDLEAIKDPYIAQVARVRKELEARKIPFEPTDAIRLSQAAPRYESEGSAILYDKFKQASGNEPATGAIKTQIEVAQEAPLIKSASQSGVDIEQVGRQKRLAELAALPKEELARITDEPDAAHIARLIDQGYEITPELLNVISTVTPTVAVPAPLKKVIIRDAPRTPPLTGAQQAELEILPGASGALKQRAIQELMDTSTAKPTEGIAAALYDPISPAQQQDATTLLKSHKDYKVGQPITDFYQGLSPADKVEANRLYNSTATEWPSKPSVTRLGERGSIVNPISQKQAEKLQTFVSNIATSLKSKLGFNTERPIEGRLLLGRLTNAYGADNKELTSLRSKGLDAFLSGPKTTKELQTWIDNNSDKVDTVVYGMSGKSSVEELRVAEVQHQLDTIGYRIEPGGAIYRRGEVTPILGTQLSEELQRLQADYNTASSRVERGINTGPRATSAYDTFVKDIDRAELESLGGRFFRIDTYIPGKVINPAEQSIHEAFDNTLAWHAIDELPKAWLDKHAPDVVAKYGLTEDDVIWKIREAQSKWGQDRRAEQQLLKEKTARSLETGITYGIQQRIKETGGIQDHPLLSDYNRIGIKATLAEARKHTEKTGKRVRLFLPDSETAMMTEGHDLVSPASVSVSYPSKDDAIAVAKEFGLTEQDIMLESYTESSGNTYWGWTAKKSIINQEPGMRLNYDKILPNIAEELTGVKGERISLGKHNNALRRVSNEAQGMELGGYRDNLIFKNPDGSPKTDISGHLYPIDNAVKQFTLYGSDKLQPAQPAQKGLQLDRGFNARSEEGAIVNPAQILKEIYEKAKPVLRPALSRIAKRHSSVGPYFKKKYEEMLVLNSQLNGPMQDHINKARSGFATADENAAHRTLYERKRALPITGKLTKEGQAAVDLNDQIVQLTFAERMEPNSPFVAAFDPATKSIVYRPPIQTPNYYFERGNKKFWNTIAGNEDDATTDATHKSFVNEQSTYGKLSTDQAEAAWNSLRSILSAPVKGGPKPTFDQLRLPEGIVLPFELQANPFDALQRGVHNQAQDIAYHRSLESDPKIGPLMGLRTNGRGEEYPPTDPILATDDVKAVMLDYAGSFDKTTQRYEAIDRAIKTGILQHVTQLRNMAQSPTALLRNLHLGEAPLVVKSLSNMLFDYTGAKNKAIQRGSVLPARNLNPTSVGANTELLSVTDIASKLVDVVQTYSGLEGLEAGHRTFFDGVGKLLAENRLRKGDAKFFDFWGPADWRSWSKDKLTDYVANRFTKSSAGSYNAEELPNFLLRGSTSYAKPLVGLARWSIGATNRYIDEVVKPAQNGDIGPLLRSTLGAFISAQAVNYISKELFDRKPRELTPEEWLKLDKKDTEYTLLSMANTAGYAGILSMLAFNGLAMKHGERTMGIANPTLEAVESTYEYVKQFVDAFQQGDVSFLDGLKTLFGQLAKDRIQLIRYATLKEEEPGRREEMIASRLGYSPRQSFRSTGRANPFSLSGRMEANDIEGMKRIIDRKRANRQSVQMPGLRRLTPGAKYVGEKLGDTSAIDKRLLKRQEQMKKMSEAMSR